MSKTKPRQESTPEMDKNIEALQHKQNGSAIEVDQESTASSKTSKASIKGMWKKAVKSLKTTKEPKEPREHKEKREQTTGSTKEKRGDYAATTSVVKERERLHSENTEKMDEKPKYSRMVCFLSLDGSPPPSPTTSSRSHSNQPSPSPGTTPTSPRTPSTPKRTISSTSFQSLLGRTSRQSSQKKGFFRKDSKDSPTADEQSDAPIDQAEIDPVYSLLKCAADLPRSNQPGVPAGNKLAHGCCARSNQSNSDLGAISTTTRSNNSRSSSPSSDFFEGPLDDSVSSTSTCSCPCHTPEVLIRYHAPILSAFKYYLPKVSKS